MGDQRNGACLGPAPNRGHFHRAIGSGEPYDFEARIRRFDGVYRWCQVRGLPLRNARGGILRWYVLLTDIDERRRAEADLHAARGSRGWSWTTFQGWSALLGFRRGRMLNQRMLEYFGKPLEEMRHWEDNDVIHPEDLPRVIRVLAHRLRQRGLSSTRRVFDVSTVSIAGFRSAGWHRVMRLAAYRVGTT